MGISFRGGRPYRRRVERDSRPTAMEKIGRGVLRLRLYLGWSQATLEAKSGVDQTTISRLERGLQTGLSIRRLAAVLDALHVGDVLFEQPRLAAPPTDLELMLRGDRWARAVREADLRLDWPATPAGQASAASDPSRVYDIDAAGVRNSCAGVVSRRRDPT
jgi:transcriptional regulator with XRE-family HTH domain